MKTLTHADIVKGQWYKVVRVPNHLKGRNYPWLNMTGVAVWVNSSHNAACIRFGSCKERVIPPYCLEEAENKATIIDCSKLPMADVDGIRLFYKNLGRESVGKVVEAEQKKLKEGQKSMVVQDVAKMFTQIGQLYRITKVPPYWIKISATKQYPSLGAVGRLIKIGDCHGTLLLSDKTQRFVPYDCMEHVTFRIPPIADKELIAKIISKPLSTLKIIKGLAKMNKDYRLRAFLDKGVISQ